MRAARFFEPGATRVKICGITQESDARMAIAAGTDALGFNFWPRSKRYLEPEAAIPWIRELAGVARIAVVVNPERELLARLQGSGCFDAIQFHGDETPEFCQQFGGRWIKALAVRSENAAAPATYGTEDFLLDAPTVDYGGSGKSADWAAAAEWVKAHAGKRFFLAGGLRSENVAAAVRAVRPQGVDVASGVEVSAGIKDPAKVREFIRQVHAMDESKV